MLSGVCQPFRLSLCAASPRPPEFARCKPLIGESGGLAELTDGSHIVRFFDIDLGVIDRKEHFRRFAPLRHRLRYAPEDQPQQKVSRINPV